MTIKIVDEYQSDEQVAGLILAAGASTRMGSPKQLLKRGNISLLDHVISEALNSELDLVVTVLGYRAQEIKRGLKSDLNNIRLRLIENSNWGTGMSSSIITGLSEVESEYDHCMVILADMPGVAPDDMDVTLERQVLTLRGHVRPHAPDGYRRITLEYREGDYERAFSLSDEVDQKKIKADFKHGVLRLELPRAAEAKPKKISVKAA